jgi:ribonuclease VapC
MIQTTWIVDASALLAAINDEQGGEYVRQHIDHCAISSVNWSEVVQKLNHAGAQTKRVEASLKALGLKITSFTEQDALMAADLWPATKTLGLSLADRACLATGLRLKTQIITADRAWKSVENIAGIKIIR